MSLPSADQLHIRLSRDIALGLKYSVAPLPSLTLTKTAFIRWPRIPNGALHTRLFTTTHNTSARWHYEWSEPVLPDESKLRVNKHFIGVGSYKPTMQELPDSVYRLAGVLAIDSEHAGQEVGDVINPLRKGIIRETDVFSIAECVTGKRTLDSVRTTAYKSVGSAIFDLFVAQALYRAAKSQGLGCEIAL